MQHLSPLRFSGRATLAIAHAPADMLVWRMDRRAVAAYLLLVARQASTRADMADRAGKARDVSEVARIQAQHERQLAAMAGMLSAWVAGGLPVDGEKPMGLLSRLRAAWAVLRG